MKLLSTISTAASPSNSAITESPACLSPVRSSENYPQMQSCCMGWCWTVWDFPRKTVGMTKRARCLSTTRWARSNVTWTAGMIKQSKCLPSWTAARTSDWSSASSRVRASRRVSMSSDSWRLQSRQSRSQSHKLLPEFQKAAVKTSTFQKSRLRIFRSQEVGKSEVQTSEKPTLIIII